MISSVLPVAVWREPRNDKNIIYLFFNIYYIKVCVASHITVHKKTNSHTVTLNSTHENQSKNTAHKRLESKQFSSSKTLKANKKHQYFRGSDKNFNDEFLGMEGNRKHGKCLPLTTGEVIVYAL